MQNGGEEGVESVVRGPGREAPPVVDHLTEAGRDRAGSFRMDRFEIGMVVQKRRHHVLVFVRLAGTGRVDEVSAGTHRAGRVPGHRQLFGREARQVGGAAAPPYLRVAPQNAQPGAGRIDEDPVEHGSERDPAAQIETHDAGGRRAHAGEGLAKQPDPGRPVVAGNELAAAAHGPRDGEGLAAGRGARVQHALAGPGADQLGHQLTGLVLGEKEPPARERRPVGIPGHDREPVAGEPRGLGLDAVLGELPPEILARGSKPIGPQRQRGRGVVEADPVGDGGEVVAIEPTFDEPARMRRGHAEIRQSGVAIPGFPRRGRQFRRLSGRRHPAEHGVDESGRARLADPFDEPDRFVDRRRRGHPIEMQQLVGAESEHRQHLPIDARDRTIGGALDDMVQRGQPAERAARELGDQRPVSIVGERVPEGGQRPRQVVAAEHRPYDVVGGGAGLVGACHGIRSGRPPASCSTPPADLSRTPGVAADSGRAAHAGGGAGRKTASDAMRRPARKSRVDCARRPSG